MRRLFSRHANVVAGWAGPQPLPPRVDPYYDGLEQGLLDSFKREAQTAAAGFVNTADVSAVAYLRLKGGKAAAVPYVGEVRISQESSPLRQWWDRIMKIEENFGLWEFAALVILDRRFQPPKFYFQAYALSPAIVGPLRDLETKVGVWLKENEMHTYGDYVGADNGSSYPEVAARAVGEASRQSPSPAYGYFRGPVEGIVHQKVYLFNTLGEAQSWFAITAYDPAQDYVAVFAATDLSQPVPGLERYGHLPRHCAQITARPQVGSVWPFLLGLPLGGLGGYFYRGWRDAHPGKWIPGLPTDHSVGGPWLDLAGPQVGGPWLDVENMPGNQPYVGGPWLDLVGPQVGGPWLDVENMPGNQPYVGGPWLDLAGPQVGGPWVDLVGAEMDVRDRRRAWLQTRGLIESAKRDVIDAQARTPAAAWVWSFDASDMSPGTQVTPFSSVTQAQAYMYERLQMPHIALALFDTHATRYWPNPIRWNKSDDPSYEPLIAQRVAEYVSTRTAGDYSGRRTTSIGSALNDVRDRAQSIASKRAGDVVGVFHATKDKLWHALAFANEDDADEWLETQEPSSFTYAAYFNKNDATWPRAVLEKIGGFRPSSKTKAAVGGASDDAQGQVKTFAYAKALATSTQGNAIGVVHLADGSWSTFSFATLDDAIDWLSSLTAHKERFSYAGAFEKAADGTAYVQQEEFGTRPAGNQRSIVATRGGYTGRAA